MRKHRANNSGPSGLTKSAVSQTPEQQVNLSEQARVLVRLAQAVTTWQGNGLFSPGVPLTPLRGEAEPTLFEYTPGINLSITPRTGFGALLSFPALRALSQVKEIRLNIELIKRQIGGMEWEIVPETTPTVEVDGESYARTIETKSIHAFFEKPNGVDEWDSWLKMLLEDLLVTDALTLYPEMNERGRLTAVNIVDGTTIRPLLDWRGRIPAPPMPAYTQMLHGMPSTWYSADRLLYKPLNTKSHTPYGETGIEWILNSINIAIRREASRNAYFTDGNIPGALVYLGDITPEQVTVIEEYVNAIIQGDIARASKLLFLPGGGSGTSVFPFQQNNQDDTTLDSWFMQVACWAFGNSPAEFGLIPGSGLGGAGFMQGAENSQFRSMIGPVSKYVSGLMNRIIRDFLRRWDVKFQFKNSAPQADKLQQAQVDQLYIGSVYTPDYVADREGIPQKYRIKGQPAAEPPTAQPPAPGGPAGLPAALLPFVKRAIRADLTTWRDRATREISKPTGRIDPYLFFSDVIRPELRESISEQLRKAGTRDEAEAVFDAILQGLDDPGGILQKSVISAVEQDPLAQMKLSAENELQQAIAEYFVGLRQRLLVTVSA
jgi:hypothetical protein